MEEDVGEEDQQTDCMVLEVAVVAAVVMLQESLQMVVAVAAAVVGRMQGEEA